MFDVSFSELMVIAVVALIVIGPEKLPKVARTIGAITGRMQRYLAQVKEEVNREVRFQELQQLQQEIQETANKTQAKLQGQTDGFMRELELNAPVDKVVEPIDTISDEPSKKLIKKSARKTGATISPKNTPIE